MWILAAGLMQLGAAMCLLPVAWALLLRSGFLFPLMPWGAGMAALGLVLALAARPD